MNKEKGIDPLAVRGLASTMLASARMFRNQTVRATLVGVVVICLVYLATASVPITAAAAQQGMTNKALPIYRLSIFGTLKPPTLAAARTIHNQTAGAPAGVAAARALSDLSHLVYVPLEQPKSTTGAGEFLILDLWTNLDGLNKFFADPQVQAGAKLIFSKRDPVVWAPADGFASYNLPAPYGKNDRFVSIVRGTVKSCAETQTVHNAIVSQSVNQARLLGNLSHEVYFRVSAPGTPESLEFLAVDVWMDAAGMKKYYQNPEFLRSLGKLFVAPPTVSTWTHPAGEWVEW